MNISLAGEQLAPFTLVKPKMSRNFLLSPTRSFKMVSHTLVKAMSFTMVSHVLITAISFTMVSHTQFTMVSHISFIVVSTY